jgi:hypothetical protein
MQSHLAIALTCEIIKAKSIRLADRERLSRSPAYAVASTGVGFGDED